MITANFTAYATYQVDSLYQWDKDRTLEIVGLELESTPRIHFTNKALDGAIIRDVDAYGAIYRVKIPNSLLQSPYTIIVYVVVDGNTVEKIEIPIIPRERPIGYFLADEDEEIYDVKAVLQESKETKALCEKTNQVAQEALTTANGASKKTDSLEKEVAEIKKNSDSSGGGSVDLDELKTTVSEAVKAGNAEEVEKIDNIQELLLKCTEPGQLQHYLEVAEDATATKQYIIDFLNLNGENLTLESTPEEIRDAVIRVTDGNDNKFIISVINDKVEKTFFTNNNEEDLTVILNGVSVAGYTIQCHLLKIKETGKVEDIKANELDAESSFLSSANYIIYDNFEVVLKSKEMLVLGRKTSQGFAETISYVNMTISQKASSSTQETTSSVSTQNLLSTEEENELESKANIEYLVCASEMATGL